MTDVKKRIKSPAVLSLVWDYGCRTKRSLQSGTRGTGLSLQKGAVSLLPEKEPATPGSVKSSARPENTGSAACSVLNCQGPRGGRRHGADIFPGRSLASPSPAGAPRRQEPPSPPPPPLRCDCSAPIFPVRENPERWNPSPGAPQRPLGMLRRQAGRRLRAAFEAHGFLLPPRVLLLPSREPAHDGGRRGGERQWRQQRRRRRWQQQQRHVQHRRGGADAAPLPDVRRRRGRIY